MHRLPHWQVFQADRRLLAEGHVTEVQADRARLLAWHGETGEFAIERYALSSPSRTVCV